MQQQKYSKGWNTTLFIDLLSALSAPVKALKANTSLIADNYASGADQTGLPVNKLTPAKDFAETLDQVQVNFLSADDAVSVKQFFAPDVAQEQNNELVTDDLPGDGSTETLVSPELAAAPLPAATPVGKQIPESGKTVPVDVSIEDASQSPDDPTFESPAFARINEISQTNVKATSEMPGATKIEASGNPPAAVSTEPAQTLNNSAVLRSAPALERGPIAPENNPLQQLTDKPRASAEPHRKTASSDLMRGSETPKLPAGLNAGSISKLLSAGRVEASETEQQTVSVKLQPAENKTAALNANPAESKPVLERVESNQFVAGAVKSAYASSATKYSGETVPVARNELAGPWIQPVEPKAVNPERIAADPLQLRVDSQPLNTASLMQRQVEQRLANQGSDTKRQQAELAVTLDTRVSAESSDRAVIAQTKTEPATNLAPKQAGVPAPIDPQPNSRQLDTAVQDQILRVMSRQALTQGRLTLQLNPHELGSLDIEFSTEKGEVQVAIVARESSTRDLLEAGVARLRQNLQEGGVNVGQLDIRHGDRQSEEQGARESMHQNVATDSAAPAAAHEDAVSPSRTDDGGIHIYV